jgi:hypothetical protein
MGYTHYMRSHRAFTAKEWADFTAEVKELIKNSTVPLANGAGDKDSKPIVNADLVSFNGVGRDSHETAYVTRNAESSSFCKTAQKPYDSIVVEFYKLIRKYTGCKLSSDGGEEVFN